MEKPTKPDLTQFGLTKREINQIEKGRLKGWFISVTEEGQHRQDYMVLLGVGIFVAALFAYHWTASAFTTILISLALLTLHKFIIELILGELDIWLSSEHLMPQYARYVRYRTAISKYEDDMRGYERWQQEEQRRQAEERQEEQRRQAEERRRQAEERRRQEGFWQSLNGWDFELELAEVFRKVGYQVESTKASGDEGVDLFLAKEAEKIVVQCKAHKKPVGSPVIRDVYGAMMHVKANRAIVASVGGFTNSAREFAKGKPIELLDLNGIIVLANKMRR